MTESEKLQIIKLVDSVKWGKVVIKKENGKIVIMYDTHARKPKEHVASQ